MKVKIMIDIVVNIIKLWESINKLQNENKTIKDLLIEVKDLYKTLEVISEKKCENFDLEVTIIDIHNGKEILTLPSKNKPLIKILITESDIGLNVLEKIIVGDQKVSDVIVSNSKLGFNINSLVDLCKGNYDDTWTILKQRTGFVVSALMNPPELKEAKEKILNNNVLWCYNTSCSGKTWLGIQILDKICVHTNKFVFNSSSKQLLNVDLLYLLLEVGSNCGIMIDDMQCDIETSIKLLDYICSNLPSLKARNIFIFLISWSKMLTLDESRNYLSQIPSIQTKPDHFKGLLKNKVSNIDANLEIICGDNLSLLSKAASLKKISKTTNYIDELYNCFIYTDEEQQVKLAYVCAVLGIYEFETPLAFLTNYGVLKKDTLKTAKFYNNQIYIEHREICAFIAKYIESNYVISLKQKDILKDYIAFLDGTLKWKALIHLVGVQRKSEVLSVGFIWNLLNTLMKTLKNESIRDPSWNKTPSSMCFVLLIADYFNDIDDFQSVAKAFCSCFSIENNHIKIDFENIKTSEDFQQIKHNMIIEDNECGQPIDYESGEDIDQEAMHTNWLLSLIVQLSSILKHFGYSNLVDIAKKELIERQNDEGFWYPKRVPWVTACALRGLSYNGYNINNELINNAVSYLISQIEEDGYWNAHTGGWNGVFETSSMCLDALNKCGVNFSENIYLNRGINYLKNNSNIWMSEDYEIDGAATACLLMDVLGVNSDLLSYIQELTKRNIETLFDTTEEEILQTESCKAALISFYVTELCWNILERDLDELMEEFIEDANETNIPIFNSKYFNSGGLYMSVNIKEVYGNIQVVENGDGIQKNIIEGINNHSCSHDSLVINFRKNIGKKCTKEEQDIIVSVLNALESESKFNSVKIKNDGVEPWGKKIQNALSCIASIATISKAAWWPLLIQLITDFINNL